MRRQHTAPSAGSQGGSPDDADAELARKLQEEEDTRVAREMATRLEQEEEMRMQVWCGIIGVVPFGQLVYGFNAACWVDGSGACCWCMWVVL